MKELDLEFHWTPVLAGPGEPYGYPGKISQYMRLTYSRPAVYCWRVEKRGVPSRIYIGETEHVVRRLRAVRKPGSDRQTNMRLYEVLTEELVGEAELVLEVLIFPPFSINGLEVTMEKLGNPHVRKLLESIAILTEMAQGSIVLNLGKELEQKRREKFARSIPKMRSTEREKLLQWWAAKAGMI